MVLTRSLTSLFTRSKFPSEKPENILCAFSPDPVSMISRATTLSSHTEMQPSGQWHFYVTNPDPDTDHVARRESKVFVEDEVPWTPSPEQSQPPSQPSTPTPRKHSRYAKISHSLLHHPGAIALYRSMAEKIEDPQVQLSFANYLLEVSELAECRYTKRQLEAEGMRWITRLAHQGLGGALYRKALWFEKHQCYRKALKLHQQAADKGVLEARYALGCYEERQGDYDEASAHYELAARKGLVKAIYRLARIMLIHRKQFMAGLDLLTLAASKTTDAFPDPLYFLGRVLTNTLSTVQCPTALLLRHGGSSAGVSCFEKAAQFGFAKAQVRIGYIYEHGLYGTFVDYAKSFGYYDAAARQGEPLGMLGLSRLYYAGWILPDEDAAYAWCRRAAELKLPDALFLLGWYHETGVGVERDYRRAVEYYTNAATRGHQAAASRVKIVNTLI